MTASCCRIIAARTFAGALEELAQMGFALPLEWFAPHLEFRFPLIGETSVAGIALELRHALEPWHVLGEESSAGNARYVDSSSERVQARVSNWVPERFTLVANGVGVPLQPTGRAGDYVGGIRFKAWSPYSALHPRIRPQVPLVLEVHDAWSGRSLGGLTHHVVHPGGPQLRDLPGQRQLRRRRAAARASRRSATARAPMARPVVEPAWSIPARLDLRAHA
jgi:uncharacterized protein (DUF2126 family)